jgi:hypothetical protein
VGKIACCGVRYWKQPGAILPTHVAAFGEIARELFDPRLQGERRGHVAGRLDESAHKLLLFFLSSSLSVPRARPAAMARQASTVSWQVNALVEATPISGPANVAITTSLSRAIVEVATLTTDTMCCRCSRA